MLIGVGASVVPDSSIRRVALPGRLKRAERQQLPESRQHGRSSAKVTAVWTDPPPAKGGGEAGGAGVQRVHPFVAIEPAGAADDRRVGAGNAVRDRADQRPEIAGRGLVIGQPVRPQRQAMGNGVQPQPLQRCPEGQDGHGQPVIGQDDPFDRLAVRKSPARRLKTQGGFRARLHGRRVWTGVAGRSRAVAPASGRAGGQACGQAADRTRGESPDPGSRTEPDGSSGGPTAMPLPSAICATRAGLCCTSGKMQGAAPRAMLSARRDAERRARPHRQAPRFRPASGRNARCDRRRHRGRR